jgi:diguanylate cyclase (GGDEF)-like protein
MDIHIARLDNLRQEIEDHEFRYDDHTFRVTITIGVAEYRPGVSLEEWIREADEMLYKGKRSGKNRVEWKH